MKWRTHRWCVHYHLHCSPGLPSCTYLPSRLMFCDIAPFSFSMESIILTGSSRLKPDGLLSCRALLFGVLLFGVLLFGPLLSEVLLLCSSAVADTAPSVCLVSSVQVVLASVSPVRPVQLSSSTSTISTSLKEFHTACYYDRHTTDWYTMGLLEPISEVKYNSNGGKKDTNKVLKCFFYIL